MKACMTQIQAANPGCSRKTSRISATRKLPAQAAADWGSTTSHMGRAELSAAQFIALRAVRATRNRLFSSGAMTGTPAGAGIRPLVFVAEPSVSAPAASLQACAAGWHRWAEAVVGVDPRARADDAHGLCHQRRAASREPDPAFASATTRREANKCLRRNTTRSRRPPSRVLGGNPSRCIRRGIKSSATVGCGLVFLATH